MRAVKNMQLHEMAAHCCVYRPRRSPNGRTHAIKTKRMSSHLYYVGFCLHHFVFALDADRETTAAFDEFVQLLALSNGLVHKATHIDRGNAIYSSLEQTNGCRRKRLLSISQLRKRKLMWFDKIAKCCFVYTPHSTACIFSDGRLLLFALRLFR